MGNAISPNLYEARFSISRAPTAMRLYIIGDIHGRSDLLDQIIEKINEDIREFGGKESLTITLGDYIDRGADSRGVIDRLSRNPFPTSYIALKGNHEVFFESFLRDGSDVSVWRRLGGFETLQSYGIPLDDLKAGHGIEEAVKTLKASIPETHLAFLSSLKNSLSIDEYFFCHAGVRPGVPLDQQSERDLLWIRDEFLKSQQDFGKMVIHGHTPREWPEIRPNRVNIDTGACATGRLTCLAIDDGGGRFLFTE
jgi:serine/threonine protein phosphatase 1